MLRASFFTSRIAPKACCARPRSYNESEPVNIGTGSEIKISELLQMIARLTRFEGEIRWQHDKPDGQPRRRLDVSRALEKFGFQAQVSLEEGLRQTIDWYEAQVADEADGARPSRKEA